MKLPKPYFAAACAACAFLSGFTGSAVADTGEKTPVNLNPAPTPRTTSTGGGSLVHTFVGLAIVIAVIYGLYWVLKQVKASRDDRASGQGLAALASLPLGSNRSLQVVRAGRDVVLLGVSEHGVTPIKSYSREEAEDAGLLPDDVADEAPVAPAGAFAGIVEELRRRTVRR